jgi:hypothetical protein
MFDVACLFILSNTVAMSISEVMLFDIFNTEAAQKIEINHTSSIQGLAWSPNNKYLATTSIDCQIHIFNTETGQMIAQGSMWDRAYQVVFSFDSSMVITGGDDKTVGLWRTQDGVEAGRIYVGGGVGTVCLANNAKTIFAGDDVGKFIHLQLEGYKFDFPTACAAYVYDHSLGAFESAPSVHDPSNGSRYQLSTEQIALLAANPDSSTLLTFGNNKLNVLPTILDNRFALFSGANVLVRLDDGSFAMAVVINMKISRVTVKLNVSASTIDTALGNVRLIIAPQQRQICASLPLIVPVPGLTLPPIAGTHAVAIVQKFDPSTNHVTVLTTDGRSSTFHLKDTVLFLQPNVGILAPFVIQGVTRYLRATMSSDNPTSDSKLIVCSVDENYIAEVSFSDIFLGVESDSSQVTRVADGTKTVLVISNFETLPCPKIGMKLEALDNMAWRVATITGYHEV